MKHAVVSHFWGLLASCSFSLPRLLSGSFPCICTHEYAPVRETRSPWAQSEAASCPAAKKEAKCVGPLMGGSPSDPISKEQLYPHAVTCVSPLGMAGERKAGLLGFPREGAAPPPKPHSEVSVCFGKSWPLQRHGAPFFSVLDLNIEI